MFTGPLRHLRQDHLARLRPARGCRHEVGRSGKQVPLRLAQAAGTAGGAVPSPLIALQRAALLAFVLPARGLVASLTMSSVRGGQRANGSFLRCDQRLVRDRKGTDDRVELALELNSFSRLGVVNEKTMARVTAATRVWNTESRPAGNPDTALGTTQSRSRRPAPGPQGRATGSTVSIVRFARAFHRSGIELLGCAQPSREQTAHRRAITHVGTALAGAFPDFPGPSCGCTVALIELDARAVGRGYGGSLNRPEEQAQ